MKMFCKFLREQAMEIINFKKKKMKLGIIVIIHENIEVLHIAHVFRG